MLVLTDKEQIEATLLDILGSIIKADSWKCRCKKCKAQKDSWDELDRHHITYDPKKLVWLCRRCHGRVTYLNGRKTTGLYRKLTNAERLEVWEEFLKEETDECQYKESELAIQDWFND